MPRASIPRRWRRSWSGCNARSRFVDNGNAPSYLRTHPVTLERIAEAQARAFGRPYRQVADSLDFHMVRALLRSYEGEAKDAVALLRQRAGRAQVQQRGRRCTTGSSHRCCAPRTTSARRSSSSTLEKMAPPHPMIDAMAGHVLHGQRRRASGNRPLRGGARALPEQDAARLRLPGSADEGRPQRRGRGVLRKAARALSRPTARCTSPPRAHMRHWTSGCCSIATRASTTRGKAI